ncbi:hypothetical protein EYF80_011831 [Liparis tanakae]|uniref:Uncharacterized protein n=1 Tax=Liparis tanakae TaxID=230148 RepID=A0A4Z2IJA4_9TELE|nr:hypothetical protein EYF80_011831 [Liparis tanakae]
MQNECREDEEEEDKGMQASQIKRWGLFMSEKAEANNHSSDDCVPLRIRTALISQPAHSCPVAQIKYT